MLDSSLKSRLLDIENFYKKIFSGKDNYKAFNDF